ncbi:protein of unknown function [Blastococcus saxobsidens DD2]|uniref:Mce-associated membrane protein n=2 Tax=Blastococcus saxobsidens TaxID=138336 RepID=H6RMU4_BLASD|nr:protein of unknown function [Blastococcus saxobsidens DD2]
MPDDRPRPTPRARPRVGARPGPRPRVAGSRRDRDETAEPGRPAVAPEAATDPAVTPGPLDVAQPPVVAPPAADPAPAPRTDRPGVTARARPSRSAGASAGGPAAAPAAGTVRRRAPAAVLVLALLCGLAGAGAGAGVLLWQRLDPAHVDPAVFAAARSGIEAVYAYDYEDSEGSVQGKLDALTGDLRDQYERDLTQGGIIDTYEQVSATTRYEVLDIGLQQVDEAQGTATLVVFGEYVVESVNSGTQPAPEGSECQVTPESAQSCVQTVRVGLVQTDGEWKISELTLLTTS